MPIKINENGFNQALAFVEDSIFKFQSEKRSTADLQKLKLLEAIQAT